MNKSNKSIKSTTTCHLREQPAEREVGNLPFHDFVHIFVDFYNLYLTIIHTFTRGFATPGEKGFLWIRTKDPAPVLPGDEKKWLREVIRRKYTFNPVVECCLDCLTRLRTYRMWPEKTCSRTCQLYRRCSNIFI